MSRRQASRTLLQPARVRKATRTRSCVLCAQPINPGQTIGLLAIGWAHHSPCIVQRHQATTEDTTCS